MKKYVIYYAPDEEWEVAKEVATEDEAIAYCEDVERICPCYYEEVAK